MRDWTWTGRRAPPWTVRRTARALWNLLHEYTTFRQGRLASLKDCDEAIRTARKEIDWLKDLPAQAAQAVLKTYRQAWANFFNPEHPAERPTFKGRFRSRMAVDVPQARDLHITRINRRWGAVNLPKIGRVRFRWTKDLPGVTKSSPRGRITGARLVKDAFGWQIVFRAELHIPAPAPHRGPKVGMDRGIAVPLALSTGDHLTHGPWLTDGEQARLLRLERTSARRRAHRTKGAPASNREHRTYDQIAKLRAKAKRRALDWQHRTTTTLAETFSVIVVEDLRIVNMMASAAGTVEEPGRRVAQKRGLNRAIAGQAWGRTVDLLTYKATDRGALVAKVAPHGTSRECHRCHTTMPGSRETQARFVCKNPACGWIGNADTNAARNQLHRYTTAAGRAVTGRGDSEVSGVCEASSILFHSVARTRAANCCVSSTGILHIHVEEHVNPHASPEDVWVWEADDHHAYQLLIDALRETPFWDRYFEVVDILVGTENGYARNYHVDPSSTIST